MKDHWPVRDIGRMPWLVPDALPVTGLLNDVPGPDGKVAR